MGHWVRDDGGRAASGRRGNVGDCFCRAVAIAAEIEYDKAATMINVFGSLERRGVRKRGTSKAEKGVYRYTQMRVMAALDFVWVPTMQIGSGCRVHLRADELPAGRLVVAVSRHCCAVVDGVIHDTHDPSRGGTRCVYGYWQPRWDREILSKTA